MELYSPKNEQTGVCIEFPLLEKPARIREISERLKSVIDYCQDFKEAFAGTNGILLHVENAKNNKPIISKNIGVKLENYNCYAKLIRETLVCRGANLDAEARINGEKLPIAALAFGDLLFIVAGLEEENGLDCIFALAVKAGIIPMDQVPGERNA